MQVVADLDSEANSVNTLNQLGAVKFDDLEWAPGTPAGNKGFVRLAYFIAFAARCWQDLSHVLGSATWWPLLRRFGYVHYVGKTSFAFVGGPFVGGGVGRLV